MEALKQDRDAFLKRNVSINYEGSLVKITTGNFIGKIHYADLFRYLSWGRVVTRAAKKAMGIKGKELLAAGLLTDAQKYYWPKPKKIITNESAAIILKDPDIMLKEDMNISFNSEGKIMFTLSHVDLVLFFPDAFRFLQWLRIAGRQAKNSQGDTKVYATLPNSIEEAEALFKEGRQHF